MRDRVAPKASRTRAAVTSTLVRMSVVMALVPTLVGAALVAAARTAAAVPPEPVADGRQVAAESVSFGFAGPVGIAAIVVGFGGLVAGLLRHRRRAAVPVGRPRVDSHAGERAA